MHLKRPSAKMQNVNHIIQASLCESCRWNRNIAGYMMTSSNGNIFRVTGLLCGEFAGHRWIPRTKASNAELWCFLWAVPELTDEQIIVNWWFGTPSRSLWRHCNELYQYDSCLCPVSCRNPVNSGHGVDYGQKTDTCHPPGEISIKHIFWVLLIGRKCKYQSSLQWRTKSQHLNVAHLVL